MHRRKAVASNTKKDAAAERVQNWFWKYTMSIAK